MQSLHRVTLLPHSPQDRQLPYLTPLQPRLPLITSFPISFYLPVNSKSSCAYACLVHPVPVQRNYPNGLQKILGLLCVLLCYLLADDWEEKIPHENKILWFRNFLQFFKEGCIHFLILIVLAATKFKQDIMIIGYSSEPHTYGNPAWNPLEEIIDKGDTTDNEGLLQGS